MALHETAIKLECTEKVVLLETQNVRGLPIDRNRTPRVDTLQLVSQLFVKTKFQQMMVEGLLFLSSTFFP